MSPYLVALSPRPLLSLTLVAHSCRTLLSPSASALYRRPLSSLSLKIRLSQDSQDSPRRETSGPQSRSRAVSVPGAPRGPTHDPKAQRCFHASGGPWGASALCDTGGTFECGGAVHSRARYQSTAPGDRSGMLALGAQTRRYSQGQHSAPHSVRAVCVWWREGQRPARHAACATFTTDKPFLARRGGVRGEGERGVRITSRV